MVEQTRQAAARGDAAVTPLAELPFVPYIDENGLVTNAEDKSAKASVYAIYDEVNSTTITVKKSLTRQVGQT